MPKGFPKVVVSASEASRRWRERNPDKVRAAEKRRVRLYDSDYRKKWWAGLTPERKKQKAAIANQRATAIRRWLDAYKLQSGCVDCGYREHHAALHFDHIAGDKSMNVSNAKSIAQAQREIGKCAVRCANCHAVRTFAFYPATYDAVPEPVHDPTA